MCIVKWYVYCQNNCTEADKNNCYLSIFIRLFENITWHWYEMRTFLYLVTPSSLPPLVIMIPIVWFNQIVLLKGLIKSTSERDACVNATGIFGRVGLVNDTLLLFRDFWGLKIIKPLFLFPKWSGFFQFSTIELKGSITEDAS